MPKSLIADALKALPKKSSPVQKKLLKELGLNIPSEDVSHFDSNIYADIAQTLFLDGDQQLRDPVDERFAADKPDVGMALSLPRQVFAAAEPDFEPKRARRVDLPVGRLFKVDGNFRQQVVDQVLLTRAENMTLPPPVDQSPTAFGRLHLSLR